MVQQAKKDKYTVEIQLGGQLFTAPADGRGLTEKPELLESIPVSYEELDSIVSHGLNDEVKSLEGRTENDVYYHISIVNNDKDPLHIRDIFE